MANQEYSGDPSLFRSAVIGLSIIRTAAAPELYAITSITLLGGLLPVAGALATRNLLNRLAHAPHALSTTTLAFSIVVLATAGVGGTAIQGVAFYLRGRMNRSIRVAVRSELFLTINSWPGIERFEDPESLNKIRLAEQAGDSAPQDLVTAIIQLGQAAVTMVGFLITLLILLPWLLLVAAIAIVPIAVIQLRLGRLRSRIAVETSGYYRRLMFYDILATDVRAAKEVRLFGLQEFLTGRMLRDLEAAGSIERSMDRAAARMEVAIGVIGGLADAIGIALTTYLAKRGQLSVGDVAAIFAALVALNLTGRTATDQVAGGFQAAMAFRHFVTLARGPESLDADVLVQVDTPPAHALCIDFDDVWFRYSDELPFALAGVSFQIRPGETIGLVGLNGAGKSTIVKLLCRMYSPDRGCIRWDGVDIAILDPQSLRNQVSAVFQDFMAYDYSAADNIGVGKLAAMDNLDQIRAAAVDAEIDAKLTGLPNGYSTVLSRIFSTDEAGHRNAQLSGGEWQRLALARAFLRDEAKLLILDEPSSGLDPQAEHSLRQRLRLLRQGRMCLLISHRLNMVRDADRILVLRSGRIVERGTHEELMTARGYYAELFSLQASGYDAAAHDQD